MERFLGDWAIHEGLQLPVLDEDPKRQRIGVIGAGLTGLSFAYQLARRGYPVTAFSAEPGWDPARELDESILPPAVLEAEIRRIEQLGVELRRVPSPKSDRFAKILAEEFDVLFCEDAHPRDSNPEVEWCPNGVWMREHLRSSGAEAEQVKIGNNVAARVERGRRVAEYIVGALSGRAIQVGSSRATVVPPDLFLDFYEESSRAVPRSTSRVRLLRRSSPSLSEREFLQESNRCLSCGRSLLLYRRLEPPASVQEMAVLVIEIRNFAEITDSMPPDDAFRFLHAYMAQVEPALSLNGGRITRYSGEGMLALFPIEEGDPVYAAIAVLELINDLNEARLAEDELPLKIGVGVHSGFLVLGNGHHTEPSLPDAFSDAINLAHAVRSAGELFGASIAVSSDAFERLDLGRQYKSRSLGKVRVSSDSDFIPVFEVFDGDPEETACLKSETLEDYKQGLRSFFDRDFPLASVCFRKVLNRNPADKTATLYLQRSAQYMVEGVAAQWQGIETLGARIPITQSIRQHHGTDVTASSGNEKRKYGLNFGSKTGPLYQTSRQRDAARSRTTSDVDLPGTLAGECSQSTEDLSCAGNPSVERARLDDHTKLSGTEDHRVAKEKPKGKSKKQESSSKMGASRKGKETKKKKKKKAKRK